MNPDAFTEFLRSSIPLVRAMDLRVLVSEPDRVRIGAPLEPNLNLHGTAFGGSLAALGILAGWALLHRGLLEAGVDAALVVRHSELDYRKPGTQMLVAESLRPDEGWDEFLDRLRHGQRAVIEVRSVVRSGEDEVLRVNGRYVALRRDTGD